MMNDDYNENAGRAFGGVEAFFLGGIALLVFGVAMFAALNTSFGGTLFSGNNNGGSRGSVTISDGTTRPGVTISSGTNSSSAKGDIICACYNEGFELASKTDNVQSTTYRTGFSQCRALAGVEGGDAWTAGWEARRSGRQFEATCKAYKRRQR